MMSKPEKQTIRKHILNNISRSKGNQTVKFPQVRQWQLNFLLYGQPGDFFWLVGWQNSDNNPKF